MDLENFNSKDTYIQLLGEVLKKKINILDKLMDLTTLQEMIITQEPFEEERFEQLILEKEEQIQALTKLDIGFERIYESVKEELSAGKHKYTTEIGNLKEMIMKITDKSVALQALEKRNKSRIEILFSQKRKAIKNSRVSSQTASNYYKTMAKQHEQQSFFYDKKK